MSIIMNELPDMEYPDLVEISIKKLNGSMGRYYYLMDNKNLLQKWNKLLKIILQQQNGIRIQLYNQLNWDILNNKGLFFICPLNKEQIITLREQYGIYLLENGRINISALNNKNIYYFIKCIKKIIN